VPNIIWVIKPMRMKWRGMYAWKRNAYRISVANPERKKPLGRPRRKWKYNIIMDFKEKERDITETIIYIT
jgi:hypothetical protein